MTEDAHCNCAALNYAKLYLKHEWDAKRQQNIALPETFCGDCHKPVSEHKLLRIDL